MMTLRQEVERDLGVIPARIGRRTPAWYLHQAPSAWRKSMKYWAVLMLGFCLGAATAGALAVIVRLA